ncbi:MAG: recombination regulator RecX [Pseudomonadales bacterium]|nr:recombination regulator RecX [Pseudomonadales bacterium]
MSNSPNQQSNLSVSELRQYAVGLLSRREYGANELRQKLSGKGEAPDVDAVIQWLQASGLQSDERFARVYVRSKAQRGYGPQRIRQEMQQKKLCSETIELAFEACDEDWYELALAVYQKKFRSPLSETKDPYKDKAKRQRFLLYRGFTAEQFAYALEQGESDCTKS